MFRSIYYIFLSYGQNIILNYYLILFAIFPSYFKNSLIEAKKLSDSYYNKMMLLSFTDDIYNKYHIDLIDVHANIIKFINSDKNNDDDNISVMSDLSDFSDFSDCNYYDE